MDTTALVVQAGLPLTNAFIMRQDRGPVYVLCDQLTPPIYVGGRFKLDEDHWLVEGQRVPVSIDPANPQKFEIDWSGVPSIEQRAAANDPTLADPHGTHEAVWAAMRQAGVMGPDVTTLPAPIGEAMAQSEAARQAATPDRFAENLARAEATPAPAGKQRAVVLIAAIAGTVQGGGTGSESGRKEVTTRGKRPAVLSVHVPGYAPYAVYVPKFKRAKDHAGSTQSGLPALVSATDRNDVEILWDEAPTTMQSVQQRLADGLQGANAAMQAEAAWGQQNLQALGVPNAGVPAGATPMPQAIPEATRLMMEQNAKAALKMVKDPAMRQQLIEQYRLAGIDVSQFE